MNLKTTIFLLLLILVGAGIWVGVALTGPTTVTSDTLATLESELKADAITRIEIAHGDRRVVLAKGADGWSLPGKWPVRQREVEQLVDVLAGLKSRFAPLPAGDKDALKKLGLDGAAAVQVTIKAGGKDYKLTFGEEPGDASRFSRPTYVRLDDAGEALRVAPGLLAMLDRSQEFYMQRRLFPIERVARDGGESGEKVEQVAAKSVSAKGNGNEFTLVRAGSTWDLSKPVRDRVDPEKIRSILGGLPDIWVEKFVEAGKKALDDYGLKDPAQVVKVQLPRGDMITLLIGKTSDKQTKIVKKGGGPPFGKPSIDIVETEFKFAKLKDNDQLFEIKADRLKDIVVAADTLRDPMLARFKADEVKKLTLDEGGKSLVFVKKDDGWKLDKPAFDADRGRVDDILDKLAGLRVGDKDILDMADPKAFGLDKPTTIKIVVESKDKDDGDKTKKKSTRTQEITFLLGKQQSDKGKLYVQVAGWDRINMVEGDLLKLARRPALAYRNRRVLNFATSDASRIDVQRAAQKYALEQAKGDWRLAAPVQAELDSRASDLPRELSQLEAVEFISADPKKEELDKLYQLARPAAIITIAFSDKKKPEQVVEIGAKRDGKDEYYARLGSDPAVFTIKKDVFETLTKDSLAYLPTELWKVDADDIVEVKADKGAGTFTLERDGDAWKLTGPFTSAVPADQVRPLASELAKLKAEKYVAHTAANLADYGLDKPYLRIALREKPGSAEPKSTGKEKQKDAKERILLIGKPTAKDAQSRYSRLGDSEAIFILGDKIIAGLDRGPLDFLDRKLLALDADAIKSIRTTSGKDTFTLTKNKDGWHVERSDGPSFAADAESVDDTLNAWVLLRAQKLAAYGDKVDLASFGLDKPAAVVVATVQEKGDKDKPGKTVEYKLLLGSVVKGSKGDRYVRLDGKPAVAILDAAVVADLQRASLDFVSRSLLKLDPARITALTRSLGSDVLELVRKADAWEIVKPVSRPADEATMRGLTMDLARLRAKKVAAYPAKDLKPFGLDTPVAALIIVAADAKTAKHSLFIGKLVDDKSGTDRYARVDNSDIVVVLPGRLSDELLAPALQFRDRLLAKAPPTAKAVLERGVRKVTFAKVDGDWKMTEPLEADAERAELDDFLKSFAALRADKLIAEKPTDLKPYGLDRPLVRWQLFSDDAKQPPLTLLIGGKDKDGKRSYAKLADNDLVFLLDDKQSSQALAEYRSRKVWPALDSFQIEKLTFGYEKTPFTLQKTGGDWQVVGKPDFKIKAEAIRDTLDALARLKADQWIVDKSADPKLFGLDPPLLVLEIETSSGKRVLKIGRQAGGSGRYYAMVPGENSGAVFLIGEAEARMIVRPLAALLAGKG
ncbi:MAG: DUF4340 domain-containing protein [Planctomycetes bacterium]|nr:DUF4340 domain-containing protein [Planctomycetota bacterium]